MQKDQAEINQILDPFLKEIRKSEIQDKPSNPNDWANRAIEQYCQPVKIDRSILSFYLLNLLKVPPGTVIFQDSGVPHAYLQGQTVEVMANSDNVVRGGLTPKYIETQMLRKLIRYDQRNISQLEPQRVSDAVVSFQPPVEEFEISVIGLDSGERSEE